MRQHRQEHMMVPARVFADFIVVHPEFGFAFFKALLHRPVVYTTAADNSLTPKTRYNVPLTSSSAGALPWYQLSFSINSVSWCWGASS
jgi:hypothetical protein